MAKQRFPTKQTIDAIAARICEQNKAMGVGCAVCGALVGSGGRKSAPAACARCYKREQRQLEPMPRRLDAELLDVKLEVHVTRQLADQVRRAARGSVPEFIRRALEQALAKPAPAADAIKWKARALVAEQQLEVERRRLLVDGGRR